MRKILASTTALVSVALLLGAGQAAAQAKKEGPIQVGIGGYFYGYFVGVSQDDSGPSATRAAEPGYGVRNYAIFRKSRIQFDGLTNLDNGVKVGLRVQLRGEANSTDQIDQSYLFFDTAFGRVELGKTPSAPNKMFYGAPTPIPGMGANSPDFLPMALPGQYNPGSNFASSPSAFINFGVASDKDEKITYFTPRIAGFQFGASFTPTSCKVGSPANGVTVCGIANGFGLKNVTGKQDQVFEAGANYVNTFGPVDAAVYIGYGQGKLAANTSTNTFRNQQQYGVGGSLVWAGFTLGAAYRYNNMGIRQGDLTLGNLPDQQQDWQVGLSYAWDQWTVGAQYQHTNARVKTATGTKAGTDTLDGWSAGVNYLLGPGITLVGGVQYFDLDSYTNLPQNQNKAWNYLVGTKLEF
jgi:outer membrane protein OmpU